MPLWTKEASVWPDSLICTSVLRVLNLVALEVYKPSRMLSDFKSQLSPEGKTNPPHASAGRPDWQFLFPKAICRSASELENGRDQRELAHCFQCSREASSRTLQLSAKWTGCPHGLGLRSQTTARAPSWPSSKEGLITSSGNSKEACLPHPESRRRRAAACSLTETRYTL
ncbi:hypothetical protein AOLI_G00190430 [Acnodon oligacanthus]